MITPKRSLPVARNKVLEPFGDLRYTPTTPLRSNTPLTLQPSAAEDSRYAPERSFRAPLQPDVSRMRPPNAA